jgi:hypothetical protein
MRPSSAGAFALAMALILPSAAAAETRYVAKAGVDAPGCTSPGAPCGSIVYAVGQAVSGDTIQIGVGTFVESVETDKVLAFVGAGGGTLDGIPAVTTIQGPDGSNAGGLPGLVLHGGGSVGSMRVVGGKGDNEAVTFGHPGGDGLEYESTGSTVLQLDHVVIVGGDGGAGTSPTDPFDYGSAGSGLHVAGPGGPANLTANESEFESGEGTGGGGAVNVVGPQAAATIVDSRVETNISFGLGSAGGITGFSGAQMTLDSVEIDAVRAGATIYEGSMTIRRSRILGAFPVQIVGSGGTSSAGEIHNSLVISNQSDALLTEAYDAGSTASANVIGSTIVALLAGAAVNATREEESGPANVTLRNTIARHLPPPEFPIPAIDLLARRGAIDADFSSFVTASGEEGGTVTTPGSAANVAADPLFTDTSKGDFALQGASPLIDRGNAALVGTGELDLPGSPRSLDGNRDCVATPDIGALEVTGQGVACDPPPTISKFGMTNRKFAPKGKAGKKKGADARGSAKAPKKGTKFTYTLSEAAKVAIVIERKQVRKGKKPRWVKATTLKAQKGSGKQSTPFNGKAKGKPLKPGKYRARITATDTAGQASAPKQTGFTVLSG